MPFAKVVTIGLALLSFAVRGVEHEYICPHSAARSLNEFKRSEGLAVQSYGVRIAAPNSDWGFVRARTVNVPGLRSEDQTLDFEHPLPATLLLMPGKTAAQSTFFFRHYGKGALAYPKPELEYINMDRLEASRRMSQTKFLVVEHDGRLHPDIDAFAGIAENVIMMSPQDRPGPLDFDRVRTINNQVLATLPGGVKSISSLDALVVSFTEVNQQQIVVLYGTHSLDARVGHLLNLSNNQESYNVVVKEITDAASNGRRVYLYGDDVSHSAFAGSLNTKGVDVVRRAMGTTKELLSTQRRMSEIGSSRPDPARTAFMNGIPTTKKALRSMQLPQAGVATWRAASEALELQMRGRFSHRIKSKADFVKVLENEDVDAVFVAAHAERKLFYIGDERITKSELKKMPQRTKHRDRPRVAILASCATGHLAEIRRGLFSTETHSFAEILIDKNFFDLVIAPDHDITDVEGLSVLSEVMAGEDMAVVRSKYNGWWKIATRGPELSRRASRKE